MNRVSVGIDIGTYHVKVVILAQDGSTPDAPYTVIGTGYSESRGMRYGYIINSIETQHSIKKAVAQAEAMAGVQVKQALVSLGGVSLECYRSGGVTIVSKADGEVASYDIERVLEHAEESLPQNTFINRHILHTIPLEYGLDGKKVHGRVEGLKGVKLEVRALFVTCLTQHINDIVDAVSDCGIVVVDVVASPFAAASVNLTKAQKIAGCVLANIGSETVSIVVYENNTPLSLAVFPLGSNDITNDIALGLKISPEDAEYIKTGGTIEVKYSKKRLEDIILARLTDIFELIQAHLSKINRNEILPAGIILTGGGVGIPAINDLAKNVLKLPSKIAETRAGSFSNNIKDATWSVAYGLAVLGMTGEKFGIEKNNPDSKVEVSKLWKWIKNFLP